jgi:hypothetical protein
MPEIILPGTYITVRDEGLITAGRVVTGNIGIVGTAAKGLKDKVHIIGSFTEAQELFGDADDSTNPDGTKNANALTLVRALEHVFNNGGRTVYAVRTAADKPQPTKYTFKTDDVAASMVLEAKTGGTWGNDILISITQADQKVSIQETLAGNTTSLNMDGAISAKSLVLQQKATGLNLLFKIIDKGEVSATEAQVLVNPKTGALTFTALATHVPKAEDSIVVRYETDSATNKKIEFFYKNTKETYLVADASHLAEQVNRRSNLFKSSDDKAATMYVKKTLSTVAMTNGTNGEAATADNYRDSLAKLQADIINIVLLAGQDGQDKKMMAALAGHINSTTENQRERIAIVGCNGTTDVNDVANHDFDSDRIIYVGPGVRVSNTETLTGAYTAAAVAGLLSSLPVQSSPTNKVLTIPSLAADYSNSELEKLVMNRVLAVEKRNGFRIVKGITTATNSAWHQITTRRIVDYAIYGVRSCCDPYIGKLNNERVRGAMKATLDAFLTRMVDDEALVSYDLTVTANRAQEIAGEAIVIMTVRPTFSIDFVRVTMYLG